MTSSAHQGLLERIKDVCRQSARGVFKRIDENRELLELLQREAPELLNRCPWIVGWIEGQDIFLTDLAHGLGCKSPFGSKLFPRAWPGESSNDVKIK